jgi:hypothetical protein
MFIYTFIIFSIACEIVRRPVTLWFSKASFRLLKNIANKKGDKFSHYLGLLLTKTGNFKRAIKTLADKGTKAMYEILKRGKFHNLSISCQLDLFDKMVKPILLYGCEL